MQTMHGQILVAVVPVQLLAHACGQVRAVVWVSKRARVRGVSVRDRQTETDTQRNRDR